MSKYSEIKNSYIELYYKKVTPVLKQMEQERKYGIIRSTVFTLITFVIGTLLIVFKDELYYFKTEEIICLGIAIIGMGFFIFPVTAKTLEQNVKEKIMPIVCSCFGNFHWQVGSNYDEKTYKAICLLPEFDLSFYDDSFYGEYNGVKIEIQEPIYQKQRGSGQLKYYQTMFDGIIIKIQMNKKFDGLTVIRKDSLFHNSPSCHLKHTELEDVEFEKKFDVYTDDEVEARYLITPSFMERIKNIENVFNV